MITSHEQEADFTHFFTNLYSIASIFNICFNMEYICTDADKAMANAIDKLDSKPVRIMCWYHLKANVVKNKSKIPANLQFQVLKDINNMRYTKSIQSFTIKKNQILKKWKSNKSLDV